MFAWLAGAVGGAAAYRALRRRPEAPAEAESRAEELRAKLAAAREGGDDRSAHGEDAGDVPLARSAEAEPLDPEARRRAVHEQGRAAIDEIRGE
jgi:hypothetical protein